MVALSPISFFSSSSIGLIILHGPHHAAEKSTSTGFGSLISSENVLVSIYLSFYFFVFCFLCFGFLFVVCRRNITALRPATPRICYCLVQEKRTEHTNYPVTCLYTYHQHPYTYYQPHDPHQVPVVQK